MAPGQEPGGDDRRDRVAGGLQRLVGGEQREHALGSRQQAQGDLESDAEETFAAHEEPRQVRAHMLEARASQLAHLAGAEHHFHAQNVVAGHAVLEAVSAARVESDVAADRADRLRRGIGSVVETVRRRGLGHLEIDDAGLDRGHPPHRVDGENPVEPVEADDQTAFDRQRAPGQTGAATARDERQAVRVAEADDRDHLLARLGKNDADRPGAERRQSVGLVDDEIGRALEEPPRRQQLLQPAQEVRGIGGHGGMLPPRPGRPPRSQRGALGIASQRIR